MQNIDNLSIDTSGTTAQPRKPRDTQLDIYRALTLILMVCVTHAMWWDFNTPEPYSSIILFTSPLMLFIAGAAMKVSGRRKGFGETVSNRFKRVWLPYYIYAGWGVAYLVIFAILSDHYDMGSYSSPITYGKILAGLELPDVPYAWQIWFILPYFIASVLFVVQRKWMDKLGGWTYLAIAFALYLATFAQPCDVVRYIGIFNFFLILGFVCYRRYSRRTLTIAAIIISVPFILLTTAGFFNDMQTHKSYVDLRYFILCFCSLVILSAIVSWIRFPQTRIFSIWNKYGYTIYLYQSFVFTVVFMGLYSIEAFATSSSIIKLSILSLSVFVIATISAPLCLYMETSLLAILKRVAQTSKALCRSTGRMW